MSSPAGYAEGADFQGGCNDQRGLRWISDGKFLMHEATINNGVILQDYLVTVAALQTLLIAVALMRAILHLLEVPYHAKLAHSGNQMALLLPILRDLGNIIYEIVKLYPRN